jgi:hypothetical protein
VDQASRLQLLSPLEASNPKFQRQWFGPHKMQYCLPNNTILLLIMDKFDFNLILVNINKYKPYKFIKDKRFQFVLIKPSDFLIKGTNGSNSF